MPLKIIQGDITNIHADAIVNAANTSLMGGGGVDGAIHRAAGPQLGEECYHLGGCETGQAKITKGYNLPAKYVIHTVGPVWYGGRHQEEKMLARCYQNSLELAWQYHVESIAFPLISTGAFGYPTEKAIRTAISVIGDFLLDHDMTVFLVIYNRKDSVISEKLFSFIARYIDERFVYEYAAPITYGEELYQLDKQGTAGKYLPATEAMAPMEKGKRSLDEVVQHLDETFSQMLLRLIDEKNMTDTATYKKANIDRKLFSKIRNDIHYKPSKPTVLAFAIALRLNLDETKDLLLRAGFALSNSSKFDIIVQYFMENNNYNIFEINEALFAFDQNLLGQ